MTKGQKPTLPARVQRAADRAYIRYVNSDAVHGGTETGFPRDGATEAARVAYQYGLRDGQKKRVVKRT